MIILKNQLNGICTDTGVTAQSTYPNPPGHVVWPYLKLNTGGCHSRVTVNNGFQWVDAR